MAKKLKAVPVFTPGEIRHFPEEIDINTPARLGHLVYTLVGTEAESTPDCLILPVVATESDQGIPATCPGYLTLPGWHYAHPDMVKVARLAFPEARNFFIILRRTGTGDEIMETKYWDKMVEEFNARNMTEGIWDTRGPDSENIFSVGVVGKDDREVPGLWLYATEHFLSFEDPDIVRLESDHTCRRGKSLSGVLTLERLIARAGMN